VEPSMHIFEDVFVELIRKTGDQRPISANARLW
jgi:hypothetical protein